MSPRKDAAKSLPDQSWWAQCKKDSSAANSECPSLVAVGEIIPTSRRHVRSRMAFFGKCPCVCETPEPVESVQITNPSNTPTHTYYIVLLSFTSKVLSEGVNSLNETCLGLTNCKAIWLHPMGPWAQSSRISSSFWDKTPKSGTHAFDEVMAHQQDAPSVTKM